MRSGKLQPVYVIVIRKRRLRVSPNSFRPRDVPKFSFRRLDWRVEPAMAFPSWRRSSLPTSNVVVLLVDSHDDSREMYSEYLRACWFTVRAADTTDLAMIYAGEADVIVTEIRV